MYKVWFFGSCKMNSTVVKLSTIWNFLLTFLFPLSTAAIILYPMGSIPPPPNILSLSSLISSAISLFFFSLSMHLPFHCSILFSFAVNSCTYFIWSLSFAILSVSTSRLIAATCFLRSFASFSAILALVRLACSLVDAKDRSLFSLAKEVPCEVRVSFKSDWSWVVQSKSCETMEFESLMSARFWVRN